MRDSEVSPVSPDVQELVTMCNEGTKDSLDTAMTLIRTWLNNNEGNDGTTALNKLSEALAKCDVGLKDITQAWSKFNRQDDSTTSQQLQIKWIGMPFFSLPFKISGTRGNRMSGAISTIARADLKNFLKFEVRFESWEESFQSEIISIDLPQIASSRKRQFLDAIAQMLETSSRLDAEGEIQQLQQYADTIKDLLRVHGYDVKIKGPPAEDFSFYVAGTEEPETAFVHGEAKKADNLPNRIQPPATSVELCWFGFASFICRNPHGNHDLTVRLRDLLGIGKPPKKRDDDKAIVLEECSSLVSNLVGLKEKDVDGDRLREVVTSITEKRRQGLVDANDALTVWGAVMQACFETVAKGKRYSIVMSLKMMWFLRLDLDAEQRCVISITDGIQMGSENANSSLLKFLTYVKEDKTMDIEPHRKWQRAITKSSKDKEKRGGNPPAKKHPRLDQRGRGGGRTGRASGVSHRTSLLSSQPNIQRTVSLDSFDDVQGTDDYGIPIPYFDQICGTVQDLGYGRCGMVKKVRWKNTFAALKRFRHKGEDDRRLPDDIYEHELSVLRDLEDLWGVHVPRLLFHKPWPSNPAIGLQVGEPMPEDMDSWTEEEQNRAALSLEEIRKFGWVQNDCRGSNFVRLTREDGSWSIAAIDLESMAWSNA